MEFEARREDGHVLVKLRGRITQKELAPDANPFGNLLGLDAYKERVLVDLSETDFLDSSGVSWLLVSHKRFRDHGGRLILHSAPPMVGNVIRVLRMHLVFEMADDLEHARKLLAQEPK